MSTEVSVYIFQIPTIMGLPAGMRCKLANKDYWLEHFTHCVHTFIHCDCNNTLVCAYIYIKLLRVLFFEMYKNGAKTMY